MLDLSTIGLTHLTGVHRNLAPPALYEEAIRRNEGWVAHNGPLLVRTGQYTGRSANDRFVVKAPLSDDKVWWGPFNEPFEQDKFKNLRRRLKAYMQGRDAFVQDCYAGADPNYRMKLRIITENAWHSLFAYNMMLREFDEEVLANFEPELTILHCPNFQAIPEIDGTRSEAFVILNLDERFVIIGGTQYGGEIKKSVFSAMNYFLPQRGVLGMHCSANVGPDGDSAIFFGLSGTGKTTLSADPERSLIGDDEHGWSDDGIFNFEGGCYAKVINLDPQAEPEIYQTTRKFGTILENVGFDEKHRIVDLFDNSLTENTRASYPIHSLPKIVKDGCAGHPKNVVMLTCDAFGILPPIARLTPAQAKYHFISGYTAKVAGTERGVTEPSATFSPLFGAPFMALHPTVYAELFGKLIEEHDVNCWLVNTGWTGGPYGEGDRISIHYSRAVLRAAMSGELDNAEYVTNELFGFEVPTSCSDVPSEVLDPRNTWTDKAAYDTKAHELAVLFTENFKKYADRAAPDVQGANPTPPALV